jgi:hypothetical protein
MGATMMHERSMTMRRNHLGADGNITGPAMAGIVRDAIAALLGTNGQERG